MFVNLVLRLVLIAGMTYLAPALARALVLAHKVVVGLISWQGLAGVMVAEMLLWLAGFAIGVIVALTVDGRDRLWRVTACVLAADIGLAAVLGLLERLL